MAKADGSIIIDTKIDTSGFNDFEKSSDELKDEFDKLSKSVKKLEQAVDSTVDETDDLADGLDDVADSAQKADKKVSKSFKEIFSASALADVATDALKSLVSSIKEMVVESISAAADIRAENAQFAETFKDLEKTATESLEAIADDAGISASRMKQSYTKTFAFTKSVGADAEAAMDIANRAMKAAADSAAYYDKSVEEATETLQSFLKGNYENDAALGIAATETTRNAKANELYATSFDRLSEAQKVDVLLAMVEAGNKASGALGQAAREADAWTNVTGEAQEAWRQFLGVLGSPILDALTPIIQSITDALKKLSKTSASTNLKKSVDDFTKSTENANKAYQETEKALESSAIMAKYYIKRLQQLESAGLDTAEAQREYATTVKNLNEMIPGLNLVIDENTGLLIANKDAIYAAIEAMKEKALYEAAQERYADSARAQAEAILDLREAEAALVTLRTEKKILTDQQVEATASLETAQNELNEAQREYDRLLNTGGQAWLEAADRLDAAKIRINELTQESERLQIEIVNNDTAQKKLNKQIDNANSVISEYDTKLQGMAESLGKVSSESDDLTEQQKALQSATIETSESVQVLRESYDAAKVSASESINAQIGLFEELSDSSDYTAEKIIQNWRSQQQAFDNYAANLQTAVDMGLDETLVTQLSDGSKESMEILNALVNDAGISIEDINKAFADVSESRDIVTSVMADISTGTTESLNKLSKDIEDQWGNMADTVGREVSIMQAYIDSLTGKSILLEIKKGNTGSSNGKVSFSESTGTASAFSVSAASLPYLASGAVIPPRAPFMAVLGDQRHGTNIEAPLSTIQEAVAMVMQDQTAAIMAGFNASVEVQREILSAVLGIQIGDDVIASAYDRYSTKMNIIRGS